MSGNHAAAVVWFEKAVPLLGKSPPTEILGDLGGLGETFVSMGVSYWETGNRDKGLALTQHGADLMEAAVKRGTLSKASLAVAYSNLAVMHRQLGEMAVSHVARAESASPATGSSLVHNAEQSDLLRRAIG